jgi:hypothetical protein
MVPHVKDENLASDDQVAIDAIAAKMMGFDPMEIKFIRMAHERGLGCGDPRDIEIAGDEALADTSWNFVGPYKKMTFASRMQHMIYWGPLKKPIEWSLKTVLAPWAYLASVVYHDSIWYPLVAKKRVQQVLKSSWGKLFANWEKLTPDAQGFESVGDEVADIELSGIKAFFTSIRLLGTCLMEAPEVAAHRRTRRALKAGES